MNMENFINKHSIVKIGFPSSEYCCTETIVDLPFELIDFMDFTKYHITCIRWWDRVRILDGSKIGYGGPRDPKHPDEYYFAETDICSFFDETSTKMDYINYLNNIKSTYQAYDLHPAFDIKSRKQLV